MSHYLMTLADGHRVDPYNIKPDDIRVENIAHSLSNLCRFGGHTREFYSVAQHSVRVARSLPPHLMLEGLLHDATESILQDVVRPVKSPLTAYKALEDVIWGVIALKFSLNCPMHHEVKYADNAVLKSEIQQFVKDPENELRLPFWTNFFAPPMVERAWAPLEAKGQFLLCFAEAIAKHAEHLHRNPGTRH